MAVRKLVINVNVEVQEVGDDAFGSPPPRSTVISYQAEIPQGTGSNAVNLAYVDERRYTASTAVDHDLAPYDDFQGNSKTIAKAKMIAFQTRNLTSGEQWQIGGDANSVPVFGAAADYLKLGPNGLFLWIDPIDGISVTAGTGDIVQVTPPAAAAVGKLVVVGSSS